MPIPLRVRGTASQIATILTFLGTHFADHTLTREDLEHPLLTEGTFQMQGKEVVFIDPKGHTLMQEPAPLEVKVDQVFRNYFSNA